MIFSLYGLLQWSPRTGRVSSIQNFDAILLDDRIGQYFVRDGFDVGLRLLARGAARERDLEELALTDFGDRSEPEAVERRADRLALRVEDGGLRSDEYASFHGNSDYRTARGGQSSGHVTIWGMSSIGQFFFFVAIFVPIVLIVSYVFSSLGRITRGVEDI